MKMIRKRYEFSPEPDLPLEDQIENQDFHKNKPSVHLVPFYSGFVVIVCLLGLYGIVFVIDGILPTALMVRDEPNYPDRFITERAVHDLKLLTSIGPRVTGGYENEIWAVDYLTREINFIIQQAHPNQKVELDIQIVSGAYVLDLLKVDQINVYANVQNIIVKLHGSNDSKNSILVNSHFDSVPTSPGGSDDGINVVAMLEILRKLSRSPNRLLHNIIFLFNGAEETPLQASHGFIAQHKWAPGCKVVINLEACGAAGKIILFQSGPETPWLMKYYSEVPHPYAQAAGEEIFQTGWIPSDTDFRVFRDFGGLVGVDMAFFKNGYRYHTKYDGFENIPWGSYQHVGDNSLHLVKSLGNAPELLETVPTPGKVVYYDIFGVIMISYTTFIASLLNIITAGLSIAAFVYSLVVFKLGATKATIKYLLLSLVCILGGWVAAALFVAFTAYVFDLLNRPMTYYGNPWLIFGLYSLPTFILSGSLLFLVNHEKLSLNIRCQMQAHLTRLIWTGFLLLGTIFSLRSVYALLLPVLFNSVAFILIYLLKLQHSVRKWQVVYLVSLIYPTLCLMYNALTTFAMFIPITGRIGSKWNPDVIIGLMSVFFTILITSSYVALVTLLKNYRYYFLGSGLMFLGFVIIAFTALGFPYSGDPQNPAPQRHWLMHTKRLFHNESWDLEKTDSGVFFLNMDRNSPNIIKPYVKDVYHAKDLHSDCDKYILCGLPLSHAKMVQIMERSTWVPASEPTIHENLKFTLNSKTKFNSTLIRYNVTVSGPDRLSVYLVPTKNVKLVNISLVHSVSTSGFPYKDRELYFILFTYGRDPSDLTFSFDLLVPENHNGTAVDVAVTAKYVHEKKMVKTPSYLQLIKEFPDWADVTAWLGVYVSYML